MGERRIRNERKGKRIGLHMYYDLKKKQQKNLWGIMNPEEAKFVKTDISLLRPTTPPKQKLCLR